MSVVDRHAHLRDPALYKRFYEGDMHPGAVVVMPPGEARFAWSRARIGVRDAVVDIGCHKGEMTGQLPLRTRGRVVGVDLSAPALGDARRFWGRTPWGRAVEWVCAAAEALPLGSDAFDVALINEVLEHVADVDAVVREAERVVRPGGRVVVSVPIDALALDGWERERRDATLGFALDRHVREVDPAAHFAGKDGLEVAERWHEMGRRVTNGPARMGFRLAAWRVV